MMRYSAKKGRSEKICLRLETLWERLFLRGERGIRTPDTLLAYTRFPGVPLKPLEHLSSALCA